MYYKAVCIVIVSLIMLYDILRKFLVSFFLSFFFPILSLGCGVGKFACGCGARGFNLLYSELLEIVVLSPHLVRGRAGCAGCTRTTRPHWYTYALVKGRAS